MYIQYYILYIYQFGHNPNTPNTLFHLLISAWRIVYIPTRLKFSNNRFDYYDMGGWWTRFIKSWMPLPISTNAGLKSVYIYYPLYTNWPITNADLPHVIIQYILYFIYQKLYWTVSGQLSKMDSFKTRLRALCARGTDAPKQCQST